MKNMTNTAARTFSKKAVSIALILAMIFTMMMPGNAFAAAAKRASKTRSYMPMHAESLFKGLNMYGKDTFKVTYDTKTKRIVSVQASQTSKGLGTDMIEKGGLKLVGKTNKVWTYRATWYLNFTLLPKPVQRLAQMMGMKISAFTSLGRICTVTVTYKVSADSLKHSMSSRFQVPSRLSSTAKKICGYFTAAF